MTGSSDTYIRGGIMKEIKNHSCACSICQGADANPTKDVHRAMNYLFAQLKDSQKTLYIGLEAMKRGPGAERGLALIFGCDEQTIAVARMQLDERLAEEDQNGEKVGGGDQNPHQYNDAKLVFYSRASIFDFNLAKTLGFLMFFPRQARNVVPRYGGFVRFLLLPV
jgi:hypothetical protein